MSAKTDVVVKLALVFCISLLSFAVGTFTGQMLEQRKNKLAQLEPGAHGSEHGDEHGTREVASEGGHGAAAVGGEHGGAKSGESMSDEEIAKLAEEFVSDDTTATGVATGGSGAGEHGAVASASGGEHGGSAEHGAAVASEREETGGHKATARKSAAGGHGEEVSATSNVRPRSLEKAEPLSAAKNIVQSRGGNEDRVPSSIPKDVTQYNTGKFTVQVGSYAKEDEAAKVVGDLKAKNYKAYYIPANVKGQTWYRVSVGMFATPREAQDYRTELMSKAKITSAIVQKIVQ